MKHNKIAVIGAGPAGISCAIQLKRYGIEPILFEKKQVGALIRNACLIENYLGFESGISGKDLAEKLCKTLDKSKIELYLSKVIKITFDFSNKYYVIETSKELFTSEILVIASGTIPKILDIPRHVNCNDKIFTEITDLPDIDYSEKKFAVIGAGDAAFDYAINLVKNFKASEVNILNRNNSPKCISVLEKRVNKIAEIKHIKNIHVKEIKNFDEKINLICLKNNNGRTDKCILSADYVISAIGRKECLDFVDNEVLNNIETLKKRGLLYLIGDVINGEYRQISIAAGQGLLAAMEINNKLN